MNVVEVSQESSDDQIREATEAWYPTFEDSGLAVATWEREYLGLHLTPAQARVAESVLEPYNLGRLNPPDELGRAAYRGRVRSEVTPFRRLAIAAATLVMTAGLAACAGPSPERSACVGTPTEALEIIAGKLRTEGELRHGRVYERGPDAQFLSAELLPKDEKEDHDGDILTWFTSDPASGKFLAVDEHAREDSSWPAADFDVREDGAIESRGCVLAVRGEPADDDCQAGFEQFC